SNPATNSTATRKGRNPDFFFSVTVAVVSEPRDRRGGGSFGVLGVALPPSIVGSFSTPPRGISFQPLASRHASSSEETNSWQLRYRESARLERPLRITPSMPPLNVGLRRCGKAGSSATIL